MTEGERSPLSRNRAMQEMLNLARAIVADGEVSDLEAKMFRAWLDRHPDLAGVWPVNEMTGILKGIFADGRLSDEERIRLQKLLEEISGQG
ncbi:MAG: hypothetical protein ACE5GJ_07940 [Gemmatimonadota bacterium]